MWLQSYQDWKKIILLSNCDKPHSHFDSDCHCTKNEVFHLSISLVNLTKSAFCWGFGYIYWKKKKNGKFHFLWIVCMSISGDLIRYMYTWLQNIRNWSKSSSFSWVLSKNIERNSKFCLITWVRSVLKKVWRFTPFVWRSDLHAASTIKWGKFLLKTLILKTEYSKISWRK